MVAVFPDDTSAASPTPLATGDPAFAIVFGDEAEMPSASRQVGTEGPDTLTGTSGSDTLIGLGGADRLGGAGGHDRLLGGDRADILRGDEGDDVLFGGRGNDVLYGGDGRDSLYGEGGDDTLDGEEGRDTILGGAGRDWIFDSAGGDLVDGGAGVDILTFRHAGRLVFTPGATFTTQLGTTVMNIDRVDIRGSEGADYLVGGFRADFLRGEGGNDALYGRGGDDSIFGGNGNDTIFGGHGDDTLSGGGGSDFLYGGPGDDVLRGGASFDVFPGSDWFDGGPGADTFLGGGVSSSITFASSSAGVTVDLATGMGHGGDAEGDRYQTGFSTVVGSSFDDTLIGGRTILGGDGADRIVQQTSTLRMTGGADIDRFEFTFNTQVLFETVRITDFDQAGGEVIDLSAIDARPAPGDQMFTFLGTGPLTGGAGELRYDSDGTQTTIDMTLDQSGQVYRVILEGDFTLTGSDFVL